MTVGAANSRTGLGSGEEASLAPVAAGRLYASALAASPQAFGDRGQAGAWDATVAGAVRGKVEALRQSLDRSGDWLIRLADRIGAWAIVWVVGAVVLGFVWADWLLPPPRFAHEPKMATEVRYRVADTFALYCGTNHPKVGGCAIVKDGVCYITIRQELTKVDRDAVLRHENGHCNGWPQNHPGSGTRVASDWGTSRSAPGDTVFLARQ